jgi:hypothetical protein
MDKAESDRIEEQLRSVFPEGAIERVQVLGYGDDPAVEPGQAAIRVFVDRAGRPEGKDADEEALDVFEKANRAVLRKLADELPRFIGWVEFYPESPAGEAMPPDPDNLSLMINTRGRRVHLDDVPEELTAVMTRLGAADLATVDTLITAGIATSRAEVMRWALGRVREHPAYAQLQERVHDLAELKAQF